MKNLKFYFMALLAVTMLFTACPPNPPVGDEGAEKVKVTFGDVTSFEIPVNFEKGDSVANYSFIVLKKGDMQNQLDNFGAMFGISDAETYVAAFGLKAYSDTTFLYKDMIPGSEYELYVLPFLVKGTAGELQIHEVTTLNLGGTGEAKVTIEVGDFAVYDQSDPVEYVQFISVYPNKECALYRYFLVEKDTFDVRWGDELAIEYLSYDNNPNYPPGFDDPYWNLYKAEENATWYVDPARTYYVVALAKNANNEYGPLVKQEFSTPAVETEEGEEPEGGETDGETGGETEPSGIQRRAIRK